MKQSCMNLKIEEALKNTDIVKIMHKASNSFSEKLDKDEIYTCEVNALWKALKNFDATRNTKFTTYLYRGVVIECLKSLKFNSKHSAKNKSLLHNNIPSKVDSNLIFSIVDELETEEERDLIIDKYMNLTIQEMAEKREYSRETVRKKLKNIYAKIRESHN